jgi:hypothetical protein
MDVDSVTRLSANDRKKLKRVFDLIDEVLSSSAPDAEGPTANAKVAFDSVCGKCDRAILWTTTTKSGSWVALDERDGPYVVLGDGRADWRGGGGFAYHLMDLEMDVRNRPKSRIPATSHGPTATGKASTTDAVALSPSRQFLPSFLAAAAYSLRLVVSEKVHGRASIRSRL